MSTYRGVLPKPAVGLLKACLFVLFTAQHAATTARAQSKPLLIDQMVHTTWTARDGAPQSIRVMAQSPDGTLWIGGQSSLFNFDGHTFTPFQPRLGSSQLPSTYVIGMCFTNDGALWLSMYGGGIAKIQNGMVTRFQTVDGHEITHVTDFKQAPDGTLWGVNRARLLLHLGRDGQWHTVVPPLGDAEGDPELLGMFVDSTNQLWITQGKRWYRRPAGASTYVTTDLPDDYFEDEVETPGGTIWVSDIDMSKKQGRLLHFNRQGDLLSSLIFDGKNAGIGSLKADRAAGLELAIEHLLITKDNTLWMATDGGGLRRLLTPILDSTAKQPEHVDVEKYTDVEGLTDNASKFLLKDSSGTVWAGGTRGLDQFRESGLIPFGAKKDGQSWTVCTSPSGPTWMGSVSTGLYRYFNGQETQFHGAKFHGSDVYSLTCARSGNVWAVDSESIWKILPGAEPKRIPLMPGAGSNSINAVAELSDGTLVAHLKRGTNWSFDASGWRKLEVIRPGHLTSYVDQAGRYWTGYSDGSVERWTPGESKSWASGASGAGAIWALAETRYGMLAAGLAGLGLLRADHLTVLRIAQSDDLRGLTGVGETPNGDVWVNGVHGLVRIPANEMEAAKLDANHIIVAESVRDGEFIGPAPLARFAPSIAVAKDGIVWAVTSTRLISVDPGRLHQYSESPKLTIHQVIVDGRPFSGQANVKPHPETIAISYNGVNLSAPDAVIYRYKLDGLDHNWQDVGPRREAIYTHLGPGHYVFEVIASNGDGHWTNPVEGASFTVLPAFYQTTWFLILCVVACLLLIWLAVMTRIRNITRLVLARAEERADERVRIARDLHDTLLQGIQGLLLTFHVAISSVPEGSETRVRLERALSKADQIVVEGRDRVTRLRTESVTDEELVANLRTVGEGLNVEARISFAVRRLGGDPQLLPHVVDEIFNIAREAMTNAFQHSGATEIIITLNYERRCFTLICTDNGCGFDESRGAEAYKRGHFGLRGMAERAERIGGKFAYVSTSTHGTEIMIRVAGSRAYKNSPWMSRVLFLLGLGRINA